MYQELNFPKAELKIQCFGNLFKVFCIVRKKNVVLTPEEWVRQNLIFYLVNYKKYPISWMSCESPLKLENTSKKRCDLVVFNKDFSVNTLVECKSFTTKLKQEHINQLMQYNRKLMASTLILSNGLNHEIIKIDYKNNKIEKEFFFPDWVVL